MTKKRYPAPGQPLPAHFHPKDSPNGIIARVDHGLMSSADPARNTIRRYARHELSRAVKGRTPYTPCKLYYDGARDLHSGHFLLTPAGSAYLVQTIRQNRNRPYRKHLGCLRWPAAEIPAEAVVHPLYWYARKAKRGVRLGDPSTGARGTDPTPRGD